MTRILKLFMILISAAFVLGASVVGGVFWHFSRDLPKLITVEDYHPPLGTIVMAQSAPMPFPSVGPSPAIGTAIQPSAPTAGQNVPAPQPSPTIIAEFYKQRRYLVPYEKIPQQVVRAFVSAEDGRFFEHSGINLISMIRAGIANFRAGHLVQGGSTITQQVAKSLLLTPERSFGRKIREVILSSRLEKNLSKAQILYLYLNQIYLGHGAYGIEAASRTYYRKSVSEISVAEAALLAGLPQAPSKYSPILNPQKAKDRQRYVLRRMAEDGFISQAQMTDAAAAPIRIYHDEDVNMRYSPHLAEHVRRYLIEKYGESQVYDGGMIVTLPTNVDLLKAGRRSLVHGLDEVDKRVGFRGPLRQLKSPEEVEKFLSEERENLILKKAEFEVLMPDGRLDLMEAMKLSGLDSELSLLEKDEKYQAVVTAVDDTKNTASVLIGGVKAKIPWERMKWAHPARDEKNPNALRVDPKSASKVLKKGDVVLVSLLSGSGDTVTVSLEQEAQIEGAVFSLDAKTGEVLAMEGGYNFEHSELNRAIQAKRQPGSTFKAFIYAAGLEKGFTPASIIVDSPIVYNDGDSGKWKPSNFEERFYGDTTFRQALIKSRNVPTVKIVQAIQVPFVIDYAKRIGLVGQFNADLSLSLGSGAVDLVNLTKAYALFPRLGRKVDPIFISTVKDRAGRLLEENKPNVSKQAGTALTSASSSPLPSAPEGSDTTAGGVAGAGSQVVFPHFPLPEDPEQVIDPRVAYVMTHLMKEVVTYGTGHAAQGLGRPAAGKTGTTSDYVDAWFMGFTPQVVTGVWVGFDNNRSIGPSETGARAALPIWLEYMREAVKTYPNEDFAVPPGVVFASINPVTGKLAGANSSSATREAFIDGTQPTEMGEKGGSSSEASPDFFKEDAE